jgi:tetratricopeptide (TPR) repeat protein
MTDDPTSLFTQAKSQQQAGRLAEAIALYRRAAELKPDYAEAHNNLGNALGLAKRFEDAVVSLRRAADLRPELAPIHSNLGLALARLKRFEEAAASHRRALELQPDLAPAHNNLAMALRELSQLREALVHYRRAIDLNPEVAEVHYNLGNTLKDLRQFEPAAAAYRRAIALRGNFAEAHSNLGVVLMTLDRPGEAEASLRKAIEAEPDSANAHNHLGMALVDLERFSEALECYGRALERDPDFASAHNNRGLALLQTGQRGQAKKAFEKAILANPGMAEAHYNRLTAMQGRPGEHETAVLEAMIAAAERPSLELSWLHFALGTAYEAQERFDEAFANFQSANRLRRGSLEYDEAAERDRFHRIRRVFTRAMMEQWAGCGSDSDLPIFIVGMARSGTTLIEQILASHPQVHGAGERSHLDKLLTAIRLADGSPGQFPECMAAFQSADFRLLGDAYVDLLQAHRATAPRIADKYLTNYANIGLIRLALPHARIVHVRREPIDACISAYCLPFLGSAQAYSYELGELGRHYRLYGDLMAHWRQALPEGAMLEVRYEDLVDDMEGGVRRILDYCGLAWDARCLAFHENDRPVKTASVNQVRRKIYRSAIGRWRRYRAHLGPLIAALGPYGPPDRDGDSAAG